MKNKTRNSPWGYGFEGIRAKLESGVAGHSLGAIRVFFGLIMVLEAVSLFQPSESTAGQIMLDTYYAGGDAGAYFPYPGFSWLPMLPKSVMSGLVVGMGVAGILMAIGWCYRFAAVCVFLIWGYLFAVESTRTYWMSYYYLELLLAFLLIWMPAAQIRNPFQRSGNEAPELIPFWPIALLRAQLVITYFYAGVAKVNPDWLLDAQPMKYFLAQDHVTLPFASATAFIKSDAFAYVLSYSGALFDLSIGFLLLWRRTRVMGLIALGIFHGTNHWLLFEDILWFPLLGVATATIFLDPDWPLQVRRWFRKPSESREPQLNSI